MEPKGAAHDAPFPMTNQTPTTRSFSLARLPGDLSELLGSMRFAVSLLMFICVASVVGTVLVQNRSSSTYIDQFGPFWFEVLDKFSIWHVYNSAWFLIIMAFLVISTSICLTRNGPKMWKDMRSFRENARVSSFRSFPHRVEGVTQVSVDETARQARDMLSAQGYAIREKRDGQTVLLAAKKGSANRLGYIFAHGAMVIICVGGLLDSELPVRLQVWLGGKQPVVENMLISQVPSSGRLSVDNPSFRSSVLIAEGARASSAVVMVNDGALVQPLPFTLHLKKFIIDYYSTGMPSRFASEVEVTDPDTGRTFDQTIEVNEPLRFKGVTVYQSSFDDGGSSVELTGYPLDGDTFSTFALSGVVGQTATVNSGKGSAAGNPATQDIASQVLASQDMASQDTASQGAVTQKAVPPGQVAADKMGTSPGGGAEPSRVGVPDLRVDLTALRPINVEDFSGGSPKPVLNFGDHVASVTGSAAGRKNETLRNVGPSVEYRIVDSSGQAHEFRNYMLPTVLDGSSVFLAGVRNGPADPFRYLRIPADESGSVVEFMRLRAALADPGLRAEAARRFAARNGATSADSPLQNASQRALDTFSQGGLQAIAGFLQTNTPASELERAADVVIRLLGASVGELRAIVREQAQMPALPETPEAVSDAADWGRLAVAALSDLTLYPAPAFFTLTDFQHVQASVFQVARTPGKNAVYLGCLLLVLGVFSMFYIRDRRVWIWLRPQDTGCEVHAAMTSQRRTLDFNREFERFKHALSGLFRP